MFSKQDARDSMPDNPLKMMYDVLMTFPNTVLHVPAQDLILTPRGEVKIAKNYRDYPVLAIFYVKYLIKKIHMK